MTHPFFSELNETLICEHKTNSWNTDDTTPYHCHDGYEILVFIGGHASFFVENDGKILEPGDIVCCPPGAFHRAMPLQDKAYDRFLIAIPHEQLEKLNTVNTNLASCFFVGVPRFLCSIRHRIRSKKYYPAVENWNNAWQNTSMAGMFCVQRF